MDDTQASRVSDAAATRKRRSSILKSQRPARTPFSELEFNVATPTDTTKSRRVSFSRRTGVAEFITNEATTTWKNFYEEHNKSLESSGNDSAANASRQPVGHIGKHIFEQQFEEVEAIDFVGNTNPGINITNSFNNFDQLASIECTDSIKLTAPNNRFEVSLLPNQTKLFSDATIGQCEFSERIDVDFSAVNLINDDLDAIQRDIACNIGNVCPRQNMSEYIEVDLNMTNVGQINDMSDMSITDTIHSPKVQDVSKSITNENRVKDSVIDKENIVVNPYVAPKETTNFAVNEEEDKVLVFDGKRLTLQPDTNVKKQRKTLLLNVNDDLPNFIEVPNCSASGYLSITDLKHNMTDSDMSITKPLDLDTTRIKSDNNKRRTLVYNNDGNISITQAVPTNIIGTQNTVMQDDIADISMTQTVPNRIITNDDKRKTIVFDDNDISMTQAIPAHIIADCNRTVVYDESGNISVTRAVPNIVISEKEKRKTIVYTDDSINISVTQAVPTNLIIENERRRTVVFESDTGNISVTQAVPSNILAGLNTQNLTSSQVLANDSQRLTDLSMTQAVPATKIITQAIKANDATKVTRSQAIPVTKILTASKDAIKDINLSVSQSLPVTNAMSEAMNSEEDGNISITQAIPVTKIITSANEINILNDSVNISMTRPVGKIYTEHQPAEDGNISITQAIPVAKILTAANELLKTDDSADISMTQAVPNTKIVSGSQQCNEDITEQANVMTRVNCEAGNISMTQAIPSNIIENNLVHFDENHVIEKQKAVEENPAKQVNNKIEGNVTLKNKEDKRRTIVFEDDADVSMTEAIPMQLIQESCKFITEKILNVQDNEVATEKVTSVTERVFNNLMSDVDKAEPINFDANTNDISMIDHSAKELVNNDKSPMKELNKTNESTKKDKVIIHIASPNYELRDKYEVIEKKVDKAKPIPTDIATLQDELFNKFTDKKNSNMQCNANISEVIVYQVTARNMDSDSARPIRNNNEVVEAESNLQMKLPKQIEDNVSEKSKVSDINNAEKDNTTIDDDKSVADIENVSKHIEDDKQEDSVSDKVNNLTDNLNVESDPVENNENVPLKCDEENDELKSVSDDSKSVNSVDSKIEVIKNAALGGIKSEEDNISEKLSQYENMNEKLKSESSGLCDEKRNEIPPETTEECDVKGINDDRVQVCDEKASDEPNVVLDNLLDMSHESLVDEDSKVDPNISDNVERDEPSNLPTNIKSTDTLFVITRDEPKSSSKKEKKLKIDETAPKEMKKHKTSVVEELKKKLKKIKHEFELPKKRRSKIEIKHEKPKSILKDETKKIKSANDTKELLDLISDLTEKQPDLERIEEKPQPEVVDEEKEKSEEQKRLSTLPRRLSFVISREDLLGNISMATQALQKSRLQLSENNISDFDITHEMSPMSPADMKKVRMSDHVVKTLQFDDDNDMSQIKLSPLRKTAFGETSYMNDSKPNVIPSYLKDVSDGVKQLMSDLMKPNADVLPFEGPGMSNRIRKTVSTCSIQANLITSSQVDIEAKKTENIETKVKLEEDINNIESKPVKDDDNISVKKNEKKNEDTVIIFDPFNPLNNICIPAIDDVETHKYEPSESDANSTSDVAQKDKTIVSHVSLSKYGATDSKGTLSCDKSVDTINQVQDTEVNTVIVMKGYKELLQNSSSLTLVDDTVPKQSDERFKVIYKLEDLENDKIDTDSEDLKPKKRVHIPNKAEHTPKPASKLAKFNKDSVKKKKHGSSFTVQQAITEFNISRKESRSADEQSVDTISSYTSSKNMGNEMLSRTSCKVSRMDWETVSEERLSCPSECDSSANVVAKIDMMPFIGSHDCEWETSSRDLWTFRLLHSRLRLAIRLAHRHENLTRTSVRADTPVLFVTLESMPVDKSNVIGTLCVSYANEAMRFEVGQGCRCAGEVPTLLRRCTGVARLATRWARVMHDARMRLAFTLTTDGAFSLKVANLPLRSVYEVTFRIAMVVNSNGGIPVPMAQNVRVLPVVADKHINDKDLEARVKDISIDWGHVPRVIWRIFKYLKNMTNESESIGYWSTKP